MRQENLNLVYAGKVISPTKRHAILVFMDKPSHRNIYINVSGNQYTAIDKDNNSVELSESYRNLVDSYLSKLDISATYKS